MPDEIKFEQNQIDYQFLVIKSHFFFTPVENRLESRSGLSRGQMITDVEREIIYATRWRVKREQRWRVTKYTRVCVFITLTVAHD